MRSKFQNVKMSNIFDLFIPKTFCSWSNMRISLYFILTFYRSNDASIFTILVHFTVHTHTLLCSPPILSQTGYTSVRARTTHRKKKLLILGILHIEKAKTKQTSPFLLLFLSLYRHKTSNSIFHHVLTH